MDWGIIKDGGNQLPMLIGGADATTAATQAATATAQAAIATAQAGAAAGSAATAASKIALARYDIPLGPKGGAIWDLSDWKTTLYQDSAATVAVTADGDPVGCIRNVLGDTNWDLIQATSGNRPTFKLLHGVPWIECAAGKGLSARTNKTFTLPCLLIGSIRADADPLTSGAYANNHFGFVLGSPQTYFYLQNNTVGTSGTRILCLAPSRGLVTASPPSYAHPVKSRMVQHALAKPGYLDCRVNDSPSNPLNSPKVTAWDGTESIAGMGFGVNVSGTSAGVPIMDAAKSMGWFGGAVLFDDPGDTLRNKLVAYFQSQLEIKIVDQGTAAGAIVFSAQPTVNSIITVNGTAFTFVASGATGNQINIGAALTNTLDNMVTVLNASAVAGVARATYSKTGTTTLTITHDAFGPDGNAFTLAAGSSPATNGTASGTTLTGGGDKVILIHGDSTTDDVDTTSAGYMPECFLSWAQTYLAPGDPTKTIYYRNWSPSLSDIFTGWQRVQTGTGPDKIFISNISVSGTQPSYHMASRFPRSIAVHSHVDEFITTHGHNMFVTLTDPTGWIRRGEYMDAMDKVRRQFPTAQHMAFRVHPLLAANYIDPVVAAIDGVAAAYGDLALADIYAKFILDGKPAGYYAADGLHLSIAVGMPVQRDVFNTAYNAWQSAKPAIVAASRIGFTSTNGLLNGRFQDFDSAAPDSWTFSAGGGATVRRATNLVDTELGDNSSIEIAQASGDSYIEQQISAVAFRGNPVVLAVRLALPVGAAGTAGRIQISSNGTGAVSPASWLYETSGKPTGLFRWAYLHLPPIPADATTITVRLHGCGVGAGKAYFGRAVLVAGSRPKDIRS